MIPDSPRWLLSKGKREEAISVLNKIARINGSKNRIAANAHFMELDN